MTTPRREQILARAKELFYEEQLKRGNESSINPTESELRENGFISLAMSQLMKDRHRSEIESDYVEFPQEFDVDLNELYESNALILGSRHTGKSDVAMLISERAMKENTIVVCFDPSLDWKTRSNIPSVMKVEPYTNLDVPNESMIYDVSMLSPNESQKVVEQFSKRLFENQAKTQDRKQYLVILEEAHTYFYEGSMRSKKMKNSVKMLSVGRNVNIACVLVSQFASMLDKFAIKHSTSQAWFGFTREPNDLMYLKKILGENVEELTKLNDGEFLYLTRDGTSKIGIEPYECDVVKTESKPKIEPIFQYSDNPIKPKQTNNLKSITSLFGCVLWFLAILLALSQLR